MKKLGRPGTILLVAALTSVGSLALAFVNPNFTPKHLERQAKLILTVKVESLAADGKGAVLTVCDAIKGKTGEKKLGLDFSKVLAAKDGKAQVEQLIDVLKSAGDRRALLAVGEFEGRECALMHVEAAWVRLRKTAGDALEFESVDPKLNGTFNGGTDMLIATMRFIRKFPDAPIMPVGGGITWSEHQPIGKLPGKAAAILAVDADGDGRRDVFAACPKGDRLFLNRGAKFEERQTGSSSLAAAWADFDGDGRPDLASLSTVGLRICEQKKPGEFTAREVKLPAKVGAANLCLWAADLGGDGRADLVAGIGGDVPLLLVNSDGKGAFQVVKPAAPEKNAGLGNSGPCVAVDLDADGLPDVLQLYRKGGLFWRGRPGGKLEIVPDCGALMGPAEHRRPEVADLDGDGLLDVLLVGGGKRPMLLQNRGGGKFEELMRQTGETHYIIQSGAGCAAAGDFNNDTFVDLFVGYGEEPPQFFFNRGFRSFAICEPLRLPEEDVEDAASGQAAGRWIDLDGNGSLELVTALAGGALYVSMSDLGDMEDPNCVSVSANPKTSGAGPVLVRFYSGGRCLGARVADPWAGPAVLGVPGPGKYQARCRLAGGREYSREVEVEEGTQKVTIGEEGKPSR